MMRVPPTGLSCALRFLAVAAIAAATPLAPAVAQATRAPAAPAGGSDAIPVQMGVSVRPESVTVGDPFVVTVRIRVPRGASVVFPVGPDSAAAAELLDPRRMAASADSAEFSATYRLAAWNVGEVPLALAPVEVRLGTQRRAVPLTAAAVFVRSVLPADSTQRAPKPPRPPIETPRSLWWLWLLALLALALLAWLIWRWMRRRDEAADAPAVDPYEAAEREFDRVARLGLVEAGERGRYVALVVDVMRDYLAHRVPGAPASLTSTELLGQVGGNASVPTARLAPLLAEADLVKFARRGVTAERAQAIGAEAREIVRHVHRAQSTPAAPPARRDAA